jgi:Flp pilus assembly protein TadG
VKTKFRFLSLLFRLRKDKHASGPRLLARLLRDEEGSYLLIMTVAMPVFIGFAGLASEGGLLFYNHRTLQSAADAAAYSAAIAYSFDTSPNITTQAKAIVASYGFTLGTDTNQANVTASGPPTNTFAGQPAVTVSISRPQTAIFSHLFVSGLSNNVSATAVLPAAAGNSGNCLLGFGMNPLTGTNDVSAAISLQGNPTINLNTCGVFTNSTDCTATGGVSVALGGNGTLTAGSVGSAGCISVNGSSEICTKTRIGTTCNSASTSQPSYTQHDGTLSDPYAAVSIPTTSSAGGCTATTFVLTTPQNKKGQVNDDGTLCPGVYPNGIWVKGNNVTLQAGIYILDYNSTSPSPQAPFTVGPNSTVNGNGVTLVFTSTGSYPATVQMMDIQNNVSTVVTLTAPTTGPTAGFVLMGDRTMPYGYLGNGNTCVGSCFSAGANANVTLNGVVYLSRGFLDWQANATTALGCRQFLVNTIRMAGTPGLNSAGCPSGGGTGGVRPIGSVVTLVR